MKYNLKEHPYIFLVIAATILVALSIVISALYKWNVFGIVAIVIAGVGFLILLGCLIYDIILFNRKKKQLEEKQDDNIKEETKTEDVK